MNEINLCSGCGDARLTPSSEPKSKAVPFPAHENPAFLFSDIFGGVGGMRLAFQNLHGKCVFTSEWDAYAQRTYEANFGEMPFGDIREANEANIPDHDILLAGFPCQSFSIAGYRQGFADQKGRGNLFLEIHRILKAKKPRAFLLENVKGLQGHDGGNTLRVIIEYLKDAGYSVLHAVLNSMDYGNVPQNRERIYIVGFAGEVDWENSQGSTCSRNYAWPTKIPLLQTVPDLLEPQVPDLFYYARYGIHELMKDKITSRDTVYQWRRQYVRENKKHVCPTLTANMGTGGHNVPLILDNKGIRKLTPRECFRFQGFPDQFVLPPDMARSHLYKQAGNSVSVPVIQRIAECMMRAMNL